jgi:hypothetical protein
MREVSPEGEPARAAGALEIETVLGGAAEIVGPGIRNE